MRSLSEGLLVNDKMSVIVIDDDQFTRTMLKSVLQGLGYSVVAEASSATEAIERAIAHSPKIALIDLDLGEGPTGIDVAHALRRKNPRISIVMLSTYQEPRFLGNNQLPLPSGSVYLVKDSLSDPSVLEQAIQRSLQADESEVTISATETAESKAFAELSDQQISVMRLVAAGYSNADIARRQWVSEAAVEKSIARLIKSLNIKAGKEHNQRVMIAQHYYQITGAVSARRS